MSKKNRNAHKTPAGIPAIAEPVVKKTPAPTEPEPAAEETLQVEEETYQTEQETVNITLATCPRCGSAERTPLKEISPRIYTDRGCVIRYRTRCLGRIKPVDRDGNPVLDADGKPVSFECGNRYKVKALVPGAKPHSRKSAS
jgi:hypothetical protein